MDDWSISSLQKRKWFKIYPFTDTLELKVLKLKNYAQEKKLLFLNVIFKRTPGILYIPETTICL